MLPTLIVRTLMLILWKNGLHSDRMQICKLYMYTSIIATKVTLMMII